MQAEEQDQVRRKGRGLEWGDLPSIAVIYNNSDAGHVRVLRGPGVHVHTHRQPAPGPCAQWQTSLQPWLSLSRGWSSLACDVRAQRGLVWAWAGAPLAGCRRVDIGRGSGWTRPSRASSRGWISLRTCSGSGEVRGAGPGGGPGDCRTDVPEWLEPGPGVPGGQGAMLWRWTEAPESQPPWGQGQALVRGRPAGCRPVDRGAEGQPAPQGTFQAAAHQGARSARPGCRRPRG